MSHTVVHLLAAAAAAVPRREARATSELLLEHCRTRLARYKIPATLEILPALPRTTVNKIDKRALKARWLNPA